MSPDMINYDDDENKAKGKKKSQWSTACELALFSHHNNFMM